VGLLLREGGKKRRSEEERSREGKGGGLAPLSEVSNTSMSPPSHLEVEQCHEMSK